MANSEKLCIFWYPISWSPSNLKRICTVIWSCLPCHAQILQRNLSGRLCGHYSLQWWFKMVWDAWDLAGRFWLPRFFLFTSKKSGGQRRGLAHWGGAPSQVAMASSSAGAVEWLTGWPAGAHFSIAGMVLSTGMYRKVSLIYWSMD